MNAIGSKESVPNPLFPAAVQAGGGRGGEKMAHYDQEPVFKTYLITRDYDIKWQKNLGSGVSGPVRLCVHRETRREYALKILLDRPKARKEVSLHWRCSDSQYVVRAIDVFTNELVLPGDSVTKKRILLVMELMEGGELFEYITRRRNFTEREASEILQQIAQAVRDCHHLNIAHRDIKPENLLLVKSDAAFNIKVKLADFGFAKIDNGDLTTPQFTPYYVAPQVLEAQKRQREIRSGQRSPGSPYYYDRSCDMWSLGVILYIMLCGYPPFYSEIPSQSLSQRMKSRIMSGSFEFPEKEWMNISDDAKDLVRNLLCVDATKRIPIDSVLAHPWLSSSSVPMSDLPSPGIMMDREAMDQAKAFHSEFLQDMRREEEGFFLKPVGKSQNKLLSSRKKTKNADEGTDGSESVTRSPATASRESLNSLKELKDLCTMPPPLTPSSSGESYADSTLIEGVKKALMYNEGHEKLQFAVQTESWNGTEFIAMVNRQRMAASLQSIIDSFHTVLVSESTI